MSSLFQNLLLWHIVSGVVAIIIFYIVLMHLLKKECKLKFLKRYSFSGFVLFLISWVSAGYYYVEYYGKNVKPVIIQGDYFWAHKVFMEAKEHIFLFLPFLSLIVFLSLHYQGKEIIADEELKKPLIFLTGIIVVLGIIITLSGVIISGAVR
ncbi:hypothetical protein KAJ41_01260 [Candidatus Parcubacteria bacterium]|nr:hypothetical protein [Candidatus Parcubacteria bacterium]